MIYIARCIFELTTPLHCGGGEGDGIFDSPVSRDAFGFWRIAGSSLAGIFRAHIKRHFGAEIEKNLFGTSHSDTQMGSHIWCSDAVLLDYDGFPAWKKLSQGQDSEITAPTFIRDHVRINTQSGAAEPGAKFDAEYVPAGTRFAFELSLDGWFKTLPNNLISAFGQLITSIKQSAFCFGGKTRNGYGHYEMLSLQCRHFNLHNVESLEQWLQLENATTFSKNCGEEWQPAEQEQLLLHSEYISGKVKIPLVSTGPLLIAGGNANEHNDADMCFATTVYYDYTKKHYTEKYTLPGSSLKGILRHRVHHIAESLGINGDGMLKSIFGHIESDSKGQKGKIIVQDAVLANKEHGTVVQHVAIDRFTGGAMDAHLFNEAPLWATDITFDLHLGFEELSALEAALLLHALMDLAEGKIALGSGGNRGNGRVKHRSQDKLSYSLSWQAEYITEENSAPLQQWIARLQDALHKVKGEAVC